MTSQRAGFMNWLETHVILHNMRPLMIHTLSCVTGIMPIIRRRWRMKKGDNRGQILSLIASERINVCRTCEIRRIKPEDER